MNARKARRPVNLLAVVKEQPESRMDRLIKTAEARISKMSCQEQDKLVQRARRYLRPK